MPGAPKKNRTVPGFTFIVVKESIRCFLRHGCFEMSVALASYGFFAVIPLLFFVTCLLNGYQGPWERFVAGGESLVTHLLPNFKMVSFEQPKLSGDYRIAGGLLSTLMIFVSLMTISDSVRTIFLKIFNVPDKESFLGLQVKNAASTGLLTIIVSALIILEAGYITYVRPIPLHDNSYLHHEHFLMSLFVMTLFVGAIYLIFSPKKLSLCQLAFASVTTAFFLTVMKRVFTVFLDLNTDYGLAFGSLKALFVIIIWVYYAFLVILFCAELAANYQKRDSLVLKKLLLDRDREGALPQKFFRRYVSTYGQNQIIFNQGDVGNEMYFIMSGSVSINRSGQVIGIMSGGDYFGEMSMLLGSERTATVEAIEDDTRLVAISRENFDSIMRENPDVVFAILKEMTLRLKGKDESL